MTLYQLFENIQSIEDISVHDGQGVVRYSGLRANFEPLTEGWTSLVNAEVDCIRAYNSKIVILLKGTPNT